MKLKISLFAFVFLLAPAFASAEVYFDGDDRGFGHCSDVGVWNSSTNTCTLNRDLTGYFEINDSGVTLDGNGHTLTGSSQYNSDGVNVYEAGSVTVKNLHITNSSYGVSFYDSPYGIAENNTIESSWGGIYFSTSPSGQIRGNTITGYWSGFGIKGGYSSDHLLVENNTVSGFDENLVLDDSSFGIIRNNTIFGGYCGIEVYRSSDNVFENNTISGSEDSGVYFSDWSTINSYRNIFSQNTIKDSNTGVFSTLVHYNDDGGGSFGSSFAPKKFLDSFFLQNVFAESDDDNLFFKNDFINNDTDVETNSLDYIRFFKLSPDGGNYWDKNTGCVDGNADGFCDAPYVIDTNLNVADNFPRIRKMGDVPTTITGTETEDDGQQDTKGVAGKTKFTFGVSYTGTAPSDVILWANDGNATSHYSLSLENSSYSFTQTFPKGHYSYHYEANGGALRFPASGELSFTAGYSNVAFLPGLEASRLYRLDGTKLWEPGILHDNSQLYLNSDGTSILSGIYADGIIDNVYHLPSKGNIYWSFIGKMNELKTDGTIHDWQPFPYDWRYSVDDTVTTAMMTKFRSLAETSDTGKVTIIAHSNGGLVAKELTIKLGDDAPKLTDQMILVASPQAGTPSAVGAILHGFQQGLPFDNWINQIITPSEARTLANNMPSAYGLLPSANYFTYTDDPVIMFGDYPLLADWREKYGTTIHSEERLRNFMTDQERETLSVNEDLKNPWKGNITLYDKANVLHNVLDTWAPPAGVELTEIAGWGDETLKTIEYYQGSKTGCKEIATLTACHTDPALEYKMQMTIDGDGTVVTSSVLWTRRARKYWVDLDDYNNTRPQSLTHFDRRHADILEVPNLLDFTKKLITRDTATLPQYILTSAPSYTGSLSRLRFTLHSPLTLDFYDNLGNHTGVSTTTNQVEENIPGSQYLTFGEVKYVSIPSTANVRLFMNGYEEGSFTLEVETVSGDTVLSSTSFAGIPSNENTTATMSITAGGEIQNLSPLLVDVNGDGILEFTLTPKSGETVLPDLSPKKEESKPANGSVPVSFLSHKEEYLEVVPPFGGATSKYSDEVAVAPSSSLVIPLKKGIHESFELNVREDDTSPKTSLKEERSDGERGVFGEKMATSTPSIQPTDLLATPFFPKTKAVETTIAITLLGGVLWIIWRW